MLVAFDGHSLKNLLKDGVLSYSCHLLYLSKNGVYATTSLRPEVLSLNVTLDN